MDILSEQPETSKTKQAPNITQAPCIPPLPFLLHCFISLFPKSPKINQKYRCCEEQSACLCAGGSLPKGIAKSLRKLEDLSWWAATININDSNPTGSNLLRVPQFFPAGQAGQSCASQQPWPIATSSPALMKYPYILQYPLVKAAFSRNNRIGSNILILSQIFYSIKHLKRLSCSGQRLVHMKLLEWLDFPYIPASPKTTGTHTPAPWGRAQCYFIP